MSRAEPSTPPAGAVDWIAYHTPSKEYRIVQARTWYAAREEATVIFSCAPADLRVALLGAP